MRYLIVNLGPPGDVVRTTLLLRVLDGEIYWLTKKNCKDVLKSKRIKKVFYIEDPHDKDELRKLSFDIIISLNEEKEALNQVSQLKSKKLIGVYLDKNNLVKYTPESAYWFDMSLVSKFGKEKADILKIKNKKPVQQILIEMLGKKWSGQEYDLGVEPKDNNETKDKIGLINVSTGLWPNKNWAHYDKLKDKLEMEGYEVKFLGIRSSISEHIEDINNCELIVCGDTLGMHLALALQKKVIALFNCTSPNEIYDYGRLKKIVSPSLNIFFYRKEFSKEAIETIKIETVYKAVQDTLKGGKYD